MVGSFEVFGVPAANRQATRNFSIPCRDQLDAEPRRVGHGDHSVPGANGLTDRLTQGCALLDHEFKEPQRVGNARQEVERGRDV